MQSLNTNLVKRPMKVGRRNVFFSQYLVILCLLLFCIYQYSIRKIYGFSIYPDEFGYWACAAEWIGYDWSECASLSSYYSFGYGLILCPILLLCKGGITAYRAAVFVNMILQCFSFFLLWKILCKVLEWLNSDMEQNVSYKLQEKDALAALCMSSFYPVWIFYMQMTLVENLLFFLYLVICCLFVNYFEKPKLHRGIFLLMALLYLYFVHMRTVGVVIAAVLTFFTYTWKEKKIQKQLFVYVIVLIGGFVIGETIKHYVYESVYATADAAVLSINNYGGQIETIKQFFTMDGIERLFISLIGKIYYMGMASYGLFYIAIWYIVRQIMEKAYFFLFLFLSVCGQLGVSAIFTWNPGRVDGFVYGRYNDYLLPILIGIGILFFLQERQPVKTVLIQIGISLLLWLISLYGAVTSNLSVMQGYFAAGISYLSNEREYQIIPEFSKAFLFGVLLIVIVASILWCGARWRKERLAIAMLLTLETLLAFVLIEKYVYAFGEGNYEKLKIYNCIEEVQETQDVVEENSMTSVSYLYCGGQAYIDLVQFMLQENPIHVIKEDTLPQEMGWEKLQVMLPQEGFLIADKDSEYLDKIEQYFEKCTESNDFVLFRVPDND